MEGADRVFGRWTSVSDHLEVNYLSPDKLIKARVIAEEHPETEVYMFKLYKQS